MVFDMEKEKIKNYLSELPAASIVRKEIERILDAEGMIFVSRMFGIQGILAAEERESVLHVWLSASRTKAAWELLMYLPREKETTLHFEEDFFEAEIPLFFETLPEHGMKTATGKRRGLIRSPGMSGRNRAIVSKKDERYKELKELKSLSGRIRNSRFLLEGSLLTERALKQNLTVEAVYMTSQSDKNETLTEIQRLCIERGAPIYEISQGMLASITDSKPTPSVMAKVFSSEKVFGREDAKFHFVQDRNLLMIDCISNPDNLGMILRTADAAGIDGVILLGNGIHYLNKNVIRGARGAIGRLPIYVIEDSLQSELFHCLKENDYQIVGMSARAENEDFFQETYSNKTVFIVGNESNGIRKEVLEQTDIQIRIPMAEGQSSLNIAVSAALVMYEIVRQYRMKG